MKRKSPPLPPCPPKDVALKSFFLGPQSENETWFRQQVNDLLKDHLTWRRKSLAKDGRAISAADQKSAAYLTRQRKLKKAAQALLHRFRQETPTFSPRYIGHMVSEVSIPALLAQFITLIHNPNNASIEVAQIGLDLERKAIARLAEMLGYDPKQCRGHFTSGGTIANIEGLWRARYRLDHFLALGLYLASEKQQKIGLFQAAHMGWEKFNHWVNADPNITDERLKAISVVGSNPWRVSKLIEKAFGIEYEGPVVLVPANKHYSWQKGVSLLGLGEEAFVPVALDAEGKLDVEDLKAKIEASKKKHRPVLAVVSVAGTTELGEVDPVHQVQKVLDGYRTREGLHVWHHVDAAYGGYYTSLLPAPSLRKVLPTGAQLAFEALRKADSITIDPHKLGYVPYASGAILVKSAVNDRVSNFKAPYLSDKKPDSGWSSTLEGSRSAAGASAVWLSSEAIGMGPNGYGRILAKGIEARVKLTEAIERHCPSAFVVKPGELNVLCFCLAQSGEALSETNRRTRGVYDAITARRQFYVSKTILGLADYRRLIERHASRWQGKIDADHLYLIRVVLMNPFILSKEMRTSFLKVFCDEIQTCLRKIK